MLVHQYLTTARVICKIAKALADLDREYALDAQVGLHHVVAIAKWWG